MINLQALLNGMPCPYCSHTTHEVYASGWGYGECTVSECDCAFVPQDSDGCA